MDNRYALLGPDMLRLLRLAGYIELLREERLPAPKDARTLLRVSELHNKLASCRQRLPGRNSRSAPFEQVGC